jgi:hypothetical protein
MRDVSGGGSATADLQGQPTKLVATTAPDVRSSARRLWFNVDLPLEP